MFRRPHCGANARHINRFHFGNYENTKTDAFYRRRYGLLWKSVTRAIRPLRQTGTRTASPRFIISETSPLLTRAGRSRELSSSINIRRRVRIFSVENTRGHSRFWSGDTTGETTVTRDYNTNCMLFGETFTSGKIDFFFFFDRKTVGLPRSAALAI